MNMLISLLCIARITIEFNVGVTNPEHYYQCVMFRIGIVFPNYSWQYHDHQGLRSLHFKLHVYEAS